MSDAFAKYVVVGVGGAGRVRMLRVGDLDPQPCGGRHVANVVEIGRARVSRLEKKRRPNRRISVVLEA